MDSFVAFDKQYPIQRVPIFNMQLARGVRMRKLLIVLLVAVAASAAILASARLYYIQTEAGGELFWNNEEAVIFISESQVGYSFRYLYYPVLWVRWHIPFGAPGPVADHSSALVITVTSDRIQKYRVDNFRLGRVSPFKGAFYGANMLPGGQLMKWSGTRFVPVSADEAKAFGAYVRNLPTGPAFSDVEGWSKQTIVGNISKYIVNNKETDRTLLVDIRGENLTFVMNSGFFTRNAYIILERPGASPETIWQLNEKFHRISKKRFTSVFGSR